MGLSACEDPIGRHPAFLRRRRLLQRSTAPPRSEPTFVLQSSAVERSNVNEFHPLEAITTGFTPNSRVTVQIFGPDGQDLNDCGAIYEYRTFARTNKAGSFAWVWWPELCYPAGTYVVVECDEATETRLSTSFLLNP